MNRQSFLFAFFGASTADFHWVSGQRQEGSLRVDYSLRSDFCCVTVRDFCRISHEIFEKNKKATSTFRTNGRKNERKRCSITEKYGKCCCDSAIQPIQASLILEPWDVRSQTTKTLTEGHFQRWFAILQIALGLTVLDDLLECLQHLYICMDTPQCYASLWMFSAARQLSSHHSEANL